MRGQPDCDQTADERLPVRHTSSTSNTVACSGRRRGCQPDQGVLETIAWYQGGKSPSPGLPCPSPCSSRRSTSPPSRPGPAASPPTSTPSRAVPCRRQRSARRELVLVVAGDVVVRLVVTAHAVACHGEDLARAGDALRLVTTIQLWFSVIS